MTEVVDPPYLERDALEDALRDKSLDCSVGEVLADDLDEIARRPALSTYGLMAHYFHQLGGLFERLDQRVEEDEDWFYLYRNKVCLRVDNNVFQSDQNSDR